MGQSSIESDAELAEIPRNLRDGTDKKHSPMEALVLGRHIIVADCNRRGSKGAHSAGTVPVDMSQRQGRATIKHVGRAYFRQCCTLFRMLSRGYPPSPILPLVFDRPRVTCTGSTEERGHTSRRRSPIRHRVSEAGAGRTIGLRRTALRSGSR